MAETRIVQGVPYTRQADGTWRKAQQAGPPADPTFDLQRPQAAANVQNTIAQTQAAQARTQAMSRQTALEERKFAAAQAAARAKATKPPISAQQRQEALKQWAAANEIDQTLPEVERAFNAGPGATRGVMGLRDFLPSEANQAYDKAAQRLRAPMKAVLGLTGGDNNAVQEQSANFGPFIGDSWNFDRTNREASAAARQKSAQTRTRSALQLGGMPDSNGRVTPLPNGYRMGQYPDLDAEIAKRIDRIQPNRRQSYMLDARKRYLAAQKPKDDNDGWSIQLLDD